LGKSIGFEESFWSLKDGEKYKVFFMYGEILKGMNFFRVLLSQLPNQSLEMTALAGARSGISA